VKPTDTLTFTAGSLERAAELRADAPAVAALKADPTSRVFPLWRGKPLVDKSASPRLVSVPFGHEVLAERAGVEVFLGRADGVACFAADISRWQPDLPPADTPVFFDSTEQRHPAAPREAVFAELRGVMAGLDETEAALAATAKAILGWHRSHRFCSSCGASSEVHMAGWQRICPACNAAHFPRTDPVVIMLITHGNSVLLGRSHGWPEGMYSLLAGFVEPGETIEAAVRREVAEETGIPVAEVGYLASQPWPYPSSLMIGCRGTALRREIELDPAELEDALWLSREECVLALAGRHEKLKPARRGSIAHYILRNWVANQRE
jgi:NAD+ diphosphatase